jgi:hypothetical protein
LSYYSLLSFADPYLFASVIAYTRYLLTGVTEMPLPMVPLGHVRWLPSFHLGLSPFGPEFFMHNHVRTPGGPGVGRLLELTLRVGDPSVCLSLGAGLRLTGLVNDLRLAGLAVSMDVAARMWRQPVLPETDDPPVLLTSADGSTGIGGMLAVAARVWLLERAGVTAELIGKTDGFVPGERLSAGLYLRGGIILRL